MIDFVQYSENGLDISRLEVKTRKARQQLGKEEGTYITVELPSLTDNFTETDERLITIGNEIRRLLPVNGLVLVVGLGNPEITPDSLGPKTSSRVLATRHISGEIARSTGLDRLRPVAVMATGYLIGQGVGRWGNFVNQEAFGCATDLPWGMYSDRTAAEVVGNVHPCFLYESILCLLGFVLLHLFTRHLRRYDGQTFLLYIIWYGVTRFFIEGLRTDSLLLPGIDLRVSQVLAAASALVAVVLLIVFRNCHKLTGCGSRKAMEAAGLTVEDKAEKVEIDDTAESTIFSGMSAEEAQEHMTVGTGVKKAAEAENEKTEGNADANTSEEPSDEAEEANETAEGESEEKNDGSEN